MRIAAGTDKEVDNRKNISYLTEETVQSMGSTFTGSALINPRGVCL